MLQEQVDIDLNLAQYMTAQNFGLVVATREITKEMVGFIRWCNLIGLPIKLWLTVRDELGYWTSIGNINPSMRIFGEFLKAIADNNLKVEAIGIDLEIPLSIANVYDQPLKYWPKVMAYNRTWAWSKQYAQDFLDKTVKESPVPVEFYAFQKPLHGLIGGGLYPTKGCKVVSMDYTGYFPGWLQGFILRIMRMRIMSFKDSVSAMGILGTVPGKTPGRLIGKNLPKHLDFQGVLTHLITLRKLGKGHLPNEIYVFALDSVETVRILSGALLKLMLVE